MSQEFVQINQSSPKSFLDQFKTPLNSKLNLEEVPYSQLVYPVSYNERKPQKNREISPISPVPNAFLNDNSSSLSEFLSKNVEKRYEEDGGIEVNREKEQSSLNKYFDSVIENELGNSDNFSELQSADPESQVQIRRKKVIENATLKQYVKHNRIYPFKFIQRHYKKINENIKEIIKDESKKLQKSTKVDKISIEEDSKNQHTTKKQSKNLKENDENENPNLDDGRIIEEGKYSKSYYNSSIEISKKSFIMNVLKESELQNKVNLQTSQTSNKPPVTKQTQSITTSHTIPTYRRFDLIKNIFKSSSASSSDASTIHEFLPYRKKDDENYKLKLLRFLHFKNNEALPKSLGGKFSRYIGGRKNEEPDKKCDRYYEVLKRKKVSSVRKIFSTHKDLYNYCLLKGKLHVLQNSSKTFNFYFDNDIGFPLEWQKDLIENQQDDDVLSDDEIVALAYNKCMEDLGDGMEDFSNNKFNCKNYRLGVVMEQRKREGRM